MPLLINVAKTNKNPAVRREAVRWLGQTHDPRALDYLEEIQAIESTVQAIAGVREVKNLLHLAETQVSALRT